MRKRNFSDIDDGAPGEDDARYASATYNSATAMTSSYSTADPQSSTSMNPIPVRAPTPSTFSDFYTTESEGRTGSNTVTVPGATSHPSLDEISYTYAVTDEIRETLYREVFGRRLNTLQPVYQQPTDDDEMQVMSFPNSNYTPPPESFVAPSEFF